MGSAKELMMERWSEHEEFQNVVAKILQHRGFKIVEAKNPDPDGPDDVNIHYDLKIRSKDGETIAVEVKRYYSEKISRPLLWNALSTLASHAGAGGTADSIMLVTNVDMPQAPSDSVGTFNDVDYQVVSLSLLKTWAMGRQDLLDNLYDVLDEIRDDHPVDTVPDIGSSLGATTPKPPRDGFDARKTIVEILACPPKNGPAFEKVCAAALKGLFDEDFNRWHDQNRVERGFHKLDLLGQLNSKNDFWKGIRYDFRSRFVVFEFKNYEAPISQDEIYTTEKYLFAGALRMVAIIVARNGEDAGAMRARHGALREHGKLIMLITQEELIMMLKQFAEGDDPQEVLVDSLYNMLRSIGR